MSSGETVFAKVIDFLPKRQFRRCVDRYKGNFRARSFTCFDQFLCMALAQLTYRDSLRDIECCLRAMKDKLYHACIRGNISRSMIADADEKRNWRIHRDFAHTLIRQARQLYAEEDFGVQLDRTVYALDATTIDLCLSVLPWAEFRQSKRAVKLHTLLDRRGSITTIVSITDGMVHEVNILDRLAPEIGAIYIMDGGYLDFERLFALNPTPAFFIIRAKFNADLRRFYSMPVDKSSGLQCDQIVKLTGFYSQKDFPEKLRRIRYYDDQHERRLVFLTNNFSFACTNYSRLISLPVADRVVL